MIEWYREYYLDLFGASRSKVCLFGESAGAMSMHYLLISEKNYLFNRLIFQSASSYSDLTYREPKDSFELTKDFASKVGCLPQFDSAKQRDLENERSSSNPLKIKLNTLNLEKRSTYDSELLGKKFIYLQK